MKRNAFTLVEMLVTLSILAVVLSIALPNMAAMVERQRLRMTVFELLGALELTRAQAVGRGVPVLLVPNDAAGSDWASGWTVLQDRDGNRRPGPGDDIIAVHGPAPRGITIASRFSGHQTPAYIAYNGNGRSCHDKSGAGARWGTLSLYQGGEIRRIRINMLGRARACDPAQDGRSCTGGDDPP